MNHDPNGNAERNFPVYTICGSMRFYQGMLSAASYYSELGYIVLMPFCDYSGKAGELTEPKEMLDIMHFAKIRMSTGIIVVTDPGGYVGFSTSNEINYARDLGLNVIWYDKCRPWW